MHVEGTRTVLRRRVFLTNCTLSKQSYKMDVGGQCWTWRLGLESMGYLFVKWTGLSC